MGMDPDLMKEYAQMGMLSKRDSQFVDGMEVFFSIACDKAKLEIDTALYRKEDTTWTYEAEGFEGIGEFVFDGYVAVSYVRITIKAKLNSGEEIVLFDNDEIKPKTTYKAKASIGDREYEVVVKTKK